MKADLIVQNARIVAQTGVFVGWLAVQDGRIAALGEGPAPGPAASQPAEPARSPRFHALLPICLLTLMRRMIARVFPVHIFSS